MRLIDADDLIDALRGSMFYSDAIPFVEEAPTVESEALKKQIPVKPMENIAGFYCPKCKRFVESVYNYCGFCGQRIEWGEEDD